MPGDTIRSRQFHNLIIFVAILGVLACALFEPDSGPPIDRIATRSRLPTLTPTAVSALQGTAAPVEPVTTFPNPSPSPTLTPVPVENQAYHQPTLVAVVGLNVRAGPGVAYPVIGQLAQDQATQLTGQSLDGAWWQIVYPPGGGGVGWVSADPQYTTVYHAEGAPIVPGPPLPTATPTMAPTITPAAVISLPTATVMAAPTLDASGWAFAGLRFDPDQSEDSLILYGAMINTTGAAQEVAFVTGSFFDAQGQLIATEADTYDRWFVGIVPAGGQMPFELTVTGIKESAGMDLRVEAEPSDETPRQDFEFLGVNASSEWGDYCLSGELRNPGDELEDYLVIVAILYDRQDKVINFSDYEEVALEEVVADQTLEFEICVDPLEQEVGRYELQAWGL